MSPSLLKTVSHDIRKGKKNRCLDPKSFTTSEVRKFYVLVVQRQEENEQKIEIEAAQSFLSFPYQNLD